jgi:hypothetical protein
LLLVWVIIYVLNLITVERMLQKVI